ncbi:MAG TPA: galactokinase [Firmicutes bacterium]|nr:galactokinase [Bacillota bacterium]
MNEMRNEFGRRFPKSGEPIVVWAPGRVNLLGEHTDYNEGFVFPMAIDAGIMMVGALNGSQEVNLYSLDFNAQDSFEVQEIQPSSEKKWTNYVRGVGQQFQLAGFELQGMDVLIKGNVPQGAGLSSSAALEVAAAVLMRALHGWDIGDVALVKLTQRAENEFVGVASGIMDQFASMMGRKDHALFLDCRSLDYDLVPTPFEEQGYAVVVANSRVQRGLVDSAYNTRRQECTDAVAQLQKDLPSITSLRDVTVDQLPLVNALPEALAQRARHVVTENHRVLTGIEALKTGDLESFGKALTASHHSLQHDFKVSCPELDLLVELALEVPGVLGSRMTGAGFGGCTVSLVPRSKVSLFEKTVGEEYLAKTGLQAEFYVFNASQGAGIRE